MVKSIVNENFSKQGLFFAAETIKLISKILRFAVQ
jgi:hypothetical protein